MAHLRDRHAEAPFQKALSYSPCIGLVGMRQVGKSTLLKKFARTYHTFDDDRFLIGFEKNGHALLESAEYPLALDEIQKYPPAFDMLKLSIDQLKRPGRFLMSGSVRFGMRRQIRESLTGRTVLIELFPFTLAECHRKKMSAFLQNLSFFKGGTLVQKLSKRSWATETQLLYYLQTGGLPGICFRRDLLVQADLMAAHLETLLARDIQLVKKTTLSVPRLMILMTELAKIQGWPVNMAHLSRLVGVSVPTVKTLLEALQALFLIRPYGSTFYLDDAGLSSYLSPVSDRFTRQDMIRLVYLDLRVQIAHSLKHEIRMNPYQTRGGVDIPFLLEFKSGKKIAVMIEEEDRPSNKALKSLTWAKKRFSSLEPMILLRTLKPFETSTGIPCLPWSWGF